jgi:hypothetical protein
MEGKGEIQLRRWTRVGGYVCVDAGLANALRDFLLGIVCGPPWSRKCDLQAVVIRPKIHRLTGMFASVLTIQHLQTTPLGLDSV